MEPRLYLQLNPRKTILKLPIMFHLLGSGLVHWQRVPTRPLCGRPPFGPKNPLLGPIICSFLWDVSLDGSEKKGFHWLRIPSLIMAADVFPSGHWLLQGVS
jgi:hypothetical protein